MNTFSSLLVAAVAATSVLSTTPSAQAATTPECGNAQVQAAYKGGEGAAGHVLGRIVLTNTSSQTCTVRGFGGLSYVGHGNGTQVGAAADRVAGTAVRTVVLRPGQKAKSLVSETSTGPYSDAECSPTPVDGFRLYLPDARASQFIAHPTTGCAARGVHLLTHQAFRRP